jgi:hypothetical protein
MTKTTTTTTKNELEAKKSKCMVKLLDDTKMYQITGQYVECAQLSAFGILCYHGIGMYYDDALLLFFRVARHSELVWLVGSNFKTLFFSKSGT